MSRTSECLNCRGANREQVLDLGSTPLANANVQPGRADEPEASFPLELMYCPDCGLVQLSEVVPPEILFSDYLYMSGASTTMVAHFGELAATHVGELGLGPDDLAMEIASNDGTLLAAFASRGVKTLGIEPAKNLVEFAQADLERATEELSGLLEQSDDKIDRVAVTNRYTAAVKMLQAIEGAFTGLG